MVSHLQKVSRCIAKVGRSLAGCSQRVPVCVVHLIEEFDGTVSVERTAVSWHDRPSPDGSQHLQRSLVALSRVVKAPASFPGQTRSVGTLTSVRGVAPLRFSTRTCLAPPIRLGAEVAAVLETEVTYTGERNSGQCPIVQGQTEFGAATFSQRRRKLILRTDTKEE